MAGAAEVGRTEFGIYANRKPFDKTMSSLEAQAQSIGKSISRKLTAGLSVASLTKFASDCLFQGSKLNAMRSMSSRAFEGMTDDLNRFAQSAAGNFGLSEKMALQFAGTFGTMANSFGFTKKQAYDMSTALTGLAGDVASFYSMSQEEAFTKLQSVFTGETESLKSLGIVMSQNALDQYALANGFAKTTSKMTEQEKVALRYQFVLSQLSLAQGDFQRTSDAWGNQIKILKLNFQSLEAQIGIGLINVLKPAIKALNMFMTKLVQVATVFAQFTQTIFGKKASSGAKKLAASTASVGAAAGSAGTGMGNLGKKASKAAKNTGKAAKALKKAERSLFGFDKINKLQAKQKDASGSTGGAGGVGSGAGGGVSGMDFDDVAGGMDDNSAKALKLGKNWDALRKACGRLREAFREFWTLMKSAGRWVLENVLKPLGEWTISKLIPKMVEILAGAFRVLTKVLEALEPAWKTIWKVFFKPMAKFTGAMIIKALDMIAAALNRITGFAEKHPKVFQTIVTGLLGLLAAKKVSPLLGLLTGKFKLFSRAIQVFGKGNMLAGIGKLGTVLLKRTKVFKKFASTAMKFRKLGGVVAKCFRVISAALAATPIGAILTGVAIAALLIWKNWDKIKKTKFGKFLKTIGTYLSGKFKKAFEKVTKIVTDFKEAWKGIKNKTVELKAKVADKIDDFKEKWDELVGGIGDKAVELKATLDDKFSSAWDKVKDTWDGVKNKTAELLTTLKDTFKSAWDKISGTWNSITGKTAEFIASMKDTFSGIWNGIKGKWSEAKTALVDKTADLVAKMTDTFSSIWNGAKTKWNEAKTALADKTATLTAKMTDTFSSIWNGAKTKWNEAKTALADKTATLTAKMSDAFSSVWSGIKSKWDEAKTDLTNKTATLKAQLENAFSGGLSAFKTKWGNAKDDIKGKTATLKATLDDNFSSSLSKFKEKWKKAKDAIKGKTAEIKMQFTDKLKKGWNALANKVNAARAKGGLAKKLLPKMPVLAQGGWVDKNTPQLAVVGDNRHEGEIVSPDSKLEAMAKQAAAGAADAAQLAEVISLLTAILNAVIAMDTNVYMDGQSITRKIVDLINQQTRSTGRCPVIV